LSREIGTSIGDYRLLKAIGSGASGEVFQAEHTLTRRIEAVKFLPHRLAGAAEEEPAMLREIAIQASLQHPHIAAVHNALRLPDGLALVMELVEGEPLSAILARGRIPLPTGAAYVLQTLDALAYAHDHRVVHRDVKPANIVVTPAGSVKLTDFGLARLFDDGQPACPGTVAGSPYYMSPEQVAGAAPADARSDCYSVGVILFEIATGQRPFEGTAFDVMLQQREAVPPAPISLAPRIGAALNTVILRALQKDPTRRFQSAPEFHAALDAALAHCPAMRHRSANRLWALAAAVATLALSAALLPALHHDPVPIQPLPSLPVALPPTTPLPEATPAPAAPVPDPPPATEPQPDLPRPTRPKPHPAARPQLHSSTSPKAFVPPDPQPLPHTPSSGDLPAALPAAPELSTLPPPDPAAQHTVEELAPAPAPVPEPAKPRSFLRRALGRIVHPLSRT
jgi:eukaryotic-like serine/threonine-protein kinase